MSQHSTVLPDKGNTYQSNTGHQEIDHYLEIMRRMVELRRLASDKTEQDIGTCVDKINEHLGDYRKLHKKHRDIQDLIHNIRTPLSNIKLMRHILCKATCNEQKGRSWKTIDICLSDIEDLIQVLRVKTFATAIC